MPFPDVLLMIANDLYYDALTDAQRARYCQYKGLDRAAFEEVTEMVNGDLHDRLTANRPRPSRVDLDAIILEVSAMVNHT